MATVQARYITGSSVLLIKCETVGQIMVHVANLHKRFGPEVAVTCPDTGRDLTLPPSQSPPSVVHIVVKPEEKSFTDANLLLALRLHGQYEDVATCARAYEMLKKRHGENALENILLLGVLDKPDFVATDNDTQKTIVQTLLRANVNLNFFLCHATANQDENKVRMLLSAGVPIEGHAVEIDESCWCTVDPPLSIAAMTGLVDMVKLLLAEKADANCVAYIPSMPYSGYGTPLLFASDSKHADVVRVLLAHKALVDFAVPFDHPIRTPLYMALKSGSEEVVELLLTNRANPVDEDEFFFFQRACKSGSVKILKMLANHGGRYRSAVFSDLLHACPSMAMVNAFLDLYMSDLFASPLLDACNHGKLDLTNVLLERQADINRSTLNGTTPLIAATSRGRLDVVSVLLARKADVNKKNESGKNALALALDSNNKNVVDLLQKHGAILPGGLQGESSNEVLACKRKLDSEDCSAVSSCKRQKSTEDETSEKKTCSSGNDVVKENEKQKHSNTGEDSKSKQITSEGCGSCASTSKDLKTLNEE